MSHKRKRDDSESESDAEAELKIVIAFDFAEGKTEEKCPTFVIVMIYAMDPADSGGREIAYHGSGFTWGFQIHDAVQRHQWFKLDLDPSQLEKIGLSQKYPDPLAAPPGYNYSPGKLTTDYMTALRKHAEHMLKHKLPASALSSTPIEWIVTVPAVWSDKARELTLACAKKAGMAQNELFIISEPEAAAVYALHKMKSLKIQKGDTFVLCDAGGGTVDCITYTVESLAPVLEIVEATPGTGALCGSSILNRRFQQFLEEKLGKDPNWDDDVLQQGTEVREIFEPVLDETVKLVTNQIEKSKKPIKAVILVGGFGQNTYLREEIAKEIKHSSVSAEVIQPPDGWTAVVKGALMKGLAVKLPSSTKVKVSGRSARKHYGTDCGHSFNEFEHPISRRYWSSYHGSWRISLVNWFIKKGDTVKEDEPVQLHRYRKSKIEDGPLRRVTSNILMSSDQNNAGVPKYKDCAEVQKLVSVNADLSRISPSLLPTKMGADGAMYYIIKYKIQVTYHSADTVYELIHNDINYGRVKAEYV
ncbi:uncharacterized protein KY384_004340 [Bacidia gigantensis]|uniref:uncharacterized protein n=1 Tax=Bacidia gigantensis TaxID=2732470 RepID=UPI001D038DE1|nr:uncharacterized protein KY384_004340 [Bacidia gigantensis]KAG8530983.1 hypothetical protein KY384_004340 [Bacidia gigantensis]